MKHGVGGVPQIESVGWRKTFIFSVIVLAEGLHVPPARVADKAVSTREVGAGRRISMMAMMSFATLVIATLLATGLAVLLDWLMLRAAFHLMQPAARGPVMQPAA